MAKLFEFIYILTERERESLQISLLQIYNKFFILHYNSSFEYRFLAICSPELIDFMRVISVLSRIFLVYKYAITK